MFWKRGVPKVKRSQFTILETAIVNYLISVIKTNDGEKIKAQLPYLTRFRRVNYKSEMGIEMYTEKKNDIPDVSLFENQSDFCIGTVKFCIRDVDYYAQIFFVLGRLFEIRIAPLPKDIKVVREQDIRFKSSKIVEEFSTITNLS